MKITLSEHKTIRQYEKASQQINALFVLASSRDNRKRIRLLLQPRFEKLFDAIKTTETTDFRLHADAFLFNLPKFELDFLRVVCSEKFPSMITFNSSSAELVSVISSSAAKQIIEQRLKRTVQFVEHCSSIQNPNSVEVRAQFRSEFRRVCIFVQQINEEFFFCEIQKTI